MKADRGGFYGRVRSAKSLISLRRQTAIQATGAQLSDEEPNVRSYKRFVARVKLQTLAADLGVSPENLRKLIENFKTSGRGNIYSELVPLVVENGDILRVTSEKLMPTLLENASQLGFTD